MKKILDRLLVLMLGIATLSGCDFLSSGSSEEKDAQGIFLRDYTTTVVQNTNYTFDGKVFLKLSDNSEKDVTSKSKIGTLSTASLGWQSFKVTYEAPDLIWSQYGRVEVIKTPDTSSTLTSITASEYTSEVKVGDTYTFNGKVTASFDDGSKADVTNDCTYSTISTASSGAKTLTISYTDPNHSTVTKSCNVTITVYSVVTGISVSESISVPAGKTARLNASVIPSDARNKDLSYVSANPSIASVDSSGVVTGNIANQSTTITITSAENNSITKTVSVSVTEAPITSDESWTVLIYMCGSDLESDGGQATLDLKEIAKVSGQPDSVNIVVQAGGSTKWDSYYSSVINKSKTNRFHLANKAYVSDSQTSQSNMADPDTLKNFIIWGVQSYPADNYGLIFWNHGGAMDGCCVDDNYSSEYEYDFLTPTEADQGISQARTALGMSDKFEFIGYDCCLMQVQDIAGLNSKHAKYQVASEESEYGYGWTYDEWVDDLFAKESTEDILTAIVDSFGTETQYIYDNDPNYSGYDNDQTLSFLDLSKWDAYEDAWEDMASTLSGIITSSSKWSTFATLLNSCQRFGLVEVDYSGNTAYAYDIFDVGSFLSKIKTNSNYKNNTELMSKISALDTLYAQLVVHEFHGSGSSGATGLTLFAPVSGYNSEDIYVSTATPFSTWRTICMEYGEWYTESSSGGGGDWGGGGGWGGWSY